MASKTIPAQVVTTCDVCHKVMSRVNEVRIRRHALDWKGMPCGDGSIVLDLCNACIVALSDVVHERAEQIRSEKRKTDAGKEE